MNPNETLKWLRWHLSAAHSAEKLAEKNYHRELVANFATDLDEWLSKGGFLPDAWSSLKQCEKCNAYLLRSDPNLCKECDLHS